MTIPSEIYDAVDNHLSFFGPEDFEDLFPEGWEDDEDFDADEILDRARNIAREEMADQIYDDLEAMCEDWITQHVEHLFGILEHEIENEL